MQAYPGYGPMKLIQNIGSLFSCHSFQPSKFGAFRLVENQADSKGRAI